MTVKISLDELVQRGAHFGHQSRRWNPKMAKYLYGIEEGVHLFDLTKTETLLTEALDFLKKAKKEGKVILFIGTKNQAKEKVKTVASSLNLPYVTERWLGGTITNFEQIKKSLQKLQEMRDKRAKGEYKQFTKKERLLIDREIERLERFFGGMMGMAKAPDVIFVIDVKKEFTAINEANKMGVTTVAVVDSNCDPSKIDYIIPMNDDATKALEYVLDLVEASLIDKSVTGKKTKATGK